MVRTAERLKKQGVKPVIIDLTSIGSQVSVSEWYFGLISYVTRQLNLTFDAPSWWNTRKEKSPVQRFSDFLHEVILDEIHQPVVIFVDEIDSTLKLEFTDDFFAAIRALYNARSQNEDLKRLTFVLLGVARPSDLIKDHTRTPYNVGVGIDVTDFKIEELGVFETVLEEAYPGYGRQILDWVLEWTGGQPYLTQKLCYAVVTQADGHVSKDSITNLVERLFLGDMARTETNLRSIRNQAEKNPHLVKMLRVYKRVLAKKKVEAEEQSIEQNELKLSGLVKTTSQGILQPRNQIYAHIFNEEWIRENWPVSATQRWAIVATVIATIAILAASFFYYQQQNQPAEIRARTYVDNFNGSSSPEVRITSLARLFQLGNGYTRQARDLFNALDPQQQLDLFELVRPENVGDELMVIVEDVYQNVENTPEGNALLGAMANSLERSKASGAASLTVEINYWLDAREAASKQDYPLAISAYTNAFEKSKKQNTGNVTLLIERASVYTKRGQYDKALADYEAAVKTDRGRFDEIQKTISENQKLVAYLQEHSSTYPTLLTNVFDRIDSILSQSLKSNFAFSVPNQMIVNESGVIDLVMNPSLSQDELSAQLFEQSNILTSTATPDQSITAQGDGTNITVSQTLVTDQMKVVLFTNNTSAFEIQKLHTDSEQLLRNTDTTRWRWIITAKEAGNHSLVIAIYRHIKFESQDYWRETEALQVNIRVRTTPSQRLASLRWSWLVGSLAMILLIFLLFRRYSRRTKRTANGS